MSAGCPCSSDDEAQWCFRPQSRRDSFIRADIAGRRAERAAVSRTAAHKLRVRRVARGMLRLQTGAERRGQRQPLDSCATRICGNFSLHPRFVRTSRNTARRGSWAALSRECIWIDRTVASMRSDGRSALRDHRSMESEEAYRVFPSRFAERYGEPIACVKTSRCKKRRSGIAARLTVLGAACFGATNERAYASSVSGQSEEPYEERFDHPITGRSRGGSIAGAFMGAGCGLFPLRVAVEDSMGLRRAERSRALE
jgi:hypothetical protein